MKLTLLALCLCACGDIATDDPLERFVAAVCACGSGFEGCAANVRSEAQGANRACLAEWADLYERTCTGRPAPTCKL